MYNKNRVVRHLPKARRHGKDFVTDIVDRNAQRSELMEFLLTYPETITPDKVANVLHDVDLDTDPCHLPLRRGEQVDDVYGEGGCRWWVLDATATEEQIEQFIDTVCGGREGWGCHCEHDCCGHTFSHGVYTKTKGTRVLVKLPWARNI